MKVILGFLLSCLESFINPFHYLKFLWHLLETDIQIYSQNFSIIFLSILFSILILIGDTFIHG